MNNVIPLKQADSHKRVRVYPLSPAELAAAVCAAGYLEYTGADFEGAVCEFVRVCVSDNKPTAKYTFRYFDDNEGQWASGALWVTLAPDGTLRADW